MLKIKLRKIGKKRTSIFKIVSLDSRYLNSRNCIYLGVIDRKRKYIIINIKKIKKLLILGVCLSKGIIKFFKLLKNSIYSNKYEIKEV
ncbi:hypothetical protein JSR06_00280 [Candidatus Vidania fulgoroideae]|uniref:Ribosomal protein S16 n=1 Tax=Candidatus Vidania fulgoroideorum TaxID=881286 RepID=A0A974XAK6_9PROT|nr:hypothetical protein JSR06_00280 [Candidatus Vidania fulgoroideae]